jgi:hypothetical protein
MSDWRSVDGVYCIMSFVKTALVLLLGLACGLAFVALTGILFKKATSFTYQDVQVTVLDKATGGPIPGARVRVGYSGEYHFGTPQPDSSITNKQGKATVKMAQGTADPWVSLKARGYFVSKTCWDTAHGAPTTCKIDPLPRIALTVPNGYVGLVKIDLPHKPQDHVTDPKVREYRLEIDAAGDAAIEGVQTLGDYWAVREALGTTFLTVRYKDGTPIPAAGDDGVTDSTVALRRVGSCFRSTSPDGKWPTEFNKAINTLGDRHSLLDEDKPLDIFVVGTAQAQKTAHDSFEGIDRIGVDFDFDVHDYNWGKTSAGFGSP